MGILQLQKNPKKHTKPSYHNIKEEYVSKQSA